MSNIKDQEIVINTADGEMTLIVFTPPEPIRGIVVFYMDSVGIRDELKEMCRRFAAPGYVVLMPDLYHRLGKLISFTGQPSEWPEEKRAELMRHIHSTSNASAMEDTRAALDWADSQPAYAGKPVGVVGYCLGGPFSFSAASKFADSVKAAASIYGVGCITDKPDSPHLDAEKISGDLYFAYAEHDHYGPPSEIQPLSECLTSAGVNHAIELYAGVTHGFAFPERKEYNEAASERHWKAVLSMFDRALH